MKRILAVSGGVDSMVLLHLFRDDSDVLVAHVNHGIRPNSKADADFVERWAEHYGREFVSCDLALGPDCSEERARAARYDFLFRCQREFGAQAVATAHHADDVLESITINLIRGTGWRGLAPLNDSRLERPLLKMTRRDILRYAAEHQVAFRQDQSNTEDKYLRNRVRDRLRDLDDASKQRLLVLYRRQSAIYIEVEALLSDICAMQDSSRSFAKDLLVDNPDLATEILRHQLSACGISLTRPQLERAVAAIATFGPGKKFSLNKHWHLQIGKYSYRVISSTLPKVAKDAKLIEHDN